MKNSSFLILHSALDRVAVLSLNRPERRNAMVPELMAALTAHLAVIKEDQKPRSQEAENGEQPRPFSSSQLLSFSPSPQHSALVLTGAGPAFCVGADLKWLGGLPDPGAGVAELVAAHHGGIRAMRALPVPIVAAVNGPAAGGGLSLALAADYRVAASTATFTAAYFRLGLPPDGGNSAFLVRTIGVARTMELLLTNRSLSAEEAVGCGLVNEVVPPEDLLDRAREVAASFPRVPPETLLATRRLLDSANSQPLDAQLDTEESAMAAAAQGEAFREALRAFLERRG